MVVSLAVLAIMMLIIVQVTTSTSSLWRVTSDKIRAFQNARAAFESMSQTVSRATLNTYYEYFDANGVPNSGQLGFTPASCDRRSELHFLSGPAAQLMSGATRNSPGLPSDSGAYSDLTSGHALFFQAPLGYTLDGASDAKALANMLNTVGYFVEYASDKELMPPLVANQIQPQPRYRLIQLIEPTEKLSVYSENWAAHTPGACANWFKSPLNRTIAAGTDPRPARVLGENIIYLIVRPKRPDIEASSAPATPIGVNYLYDSRPKPSITTADAASYPTRHQLPPLVGVTLVAIDELSAERLEHKYPNQKPLKALGVDHLFETTPDTNDPTAFNADLNQLIEKLSENKINYRVFDTEVMIQSSKWSQN